MLKQRMGFTIMYLALCAGVYYFSWVLLTILMMFSIVLLVKQHMTAQSMKWMLAGAGGLVILFLGVVTFFGILSLGIFNMGGTMEKSAYVQSDYASVQEAAPREVMAKSMNVIGAGEGAINVPVREGVLPVRLELPALGKTIRVTSHLVHKDDPLRISVLLAAGWLKYGLYLVSLAAGFYCVRQYRRA